jgi:glycosyltransferase involved in cell wall biosynthesis
MRIGLLVNALPRAAAEIAAPTGGVGVYTRNLLDALLDVDQQNEYFLISYSQPVASVWETARSHRCAVPVTMFNRVFRELDLPYHRAARRLGCDVLHSLNHFEGLLGASGVRTVATIYDVSPLRFPNCHRLGLVCRWRLGAPLARWFVDHVITTSQHSKRDIEQTMGIAGDRISVIPPGLSGEFGSPGTNTDCNWLGVPRPFVLCVSTFEPRKNLARLVRAFDRLHESHPDVSLVLAGLSGWRTNLAHVLPASPSVRRRIHLLQNLSTDRIAQLYRGCLFSVYPSLYEGFGLPVLESMACGAPVLASSASSIPEVGGDAVVYFDPHDELDLTCQLDRLLSDGRLREQMRRRGRDRAQQYDWHNAARQTLQVYDRIA